MPARNQPADVPVAPERASADVRTPQPGAPVPGRRFERERARTPARTLVFEPSASLVEPLAARDRLSRRALMAADVAALGVVLFVAAAAGLKLASGAALLPAVLVTLAKALGLYDRDELILRRTTLEETPSVALL